VEKELNGTTDLVHSGLAMRNLVDQQLYLHKETELEVYDLLIV
jgi:hypothetical protein